MKGWSSVCVFAICVLLHVPLGGCQDPERQAALELLEELFVTRSYNKKIGPVYRDDPLGLDVIVSFYLFSINALDESSETLTLTVTLYFQWVDDQLNWEKADYNNIGYLILPQKDFWLPEIFLTNSIGENKPVGADSLNVKLHSDGNVFWTVFQVFQSACSIDIKYFPFDTQKCHLELASWSYSTDEMFLTNIGKETIQLQDYEENASWEILDTSVVTQGINEEGEAKIVYTLTLKRKPAHALMSLVLPVFVLALLNLTVFILPSNSGEKSGYAMTLFLAMIVFLTIFSTMLPKNSETISLLSVYVTIQTLQSMLITFITVVSIRMSVFDESAPVPKVWVLLGKLVRCNICRKKCTRRRSNKVDNSSDAISDYKEESTEEEPREEPYTWAHVTNDLDILCTVFFGTCFVISTCVCSIVLNAP